MAKKTKTPRTGRPRLGRIKIHVTLCRDAMDALDSVSRERNTTRGELLDAMILGSYRRKKGRARARPSATKGNDS